MEANVKSADDRSIWLKVWQFPLVAMIVGIALIIGCAYLVTLLSTLPVFAQLDESLSAPVLSLTLVLLCFVVYKLIIRKLGRKKHDDLPLDLGAVRDTVKGFGLGALLISICVGLAAIFGSYRITGWDNFGDWAYIVFVFGVYAGFFEELLIRGIMLRWLEEITGTWIAIGISALVFGFLHAGNANATFFSSLAISIEAGILLGAAYVLTRSLWFAIGIHAGWNVVQALWDVPVSGNPTEGPIAATLEGPFLLAGGGFGLEATIFALVVATGAGIWMLVKVVGNRKIVQPIWSRRGGEITAY